MGRRNRSRPVMPRKLIFIFVVVVMIVLIVYLLCDRYCWCGGASRIQVGRSHIAVRDGDENPFEVQAFAVDEGGRRLACNLSFLAEGSGLESVGGSRFACTKAGQGTVRVSLGKRHFENVAVRCLFVDRIEVSNPPPLSVGDPPWRLEVKAYSGDELVPDAVIETESSRPGIVRVEEGYLVPLAVGRAVITVRSGRATTSVQVTVGERVLGEFIEIEDGDFAEWRLSPGHYFVEVQARPKGGSGKSGVTLSWVGAFCPNQGEDQLHRLSCLVENESVLRLDNPCFRCKFPIPRVDVSGYLRVTRIP